jgi:hypothetical protein
MCSQARAPYGFGRGAVVGGVIGWVAIVGSSLVWLFVARVEVEQRQLVGAAHQRRTRRSG